MGEFWASTGTRRTWTRLSPALVIAVFAALLVLLGFPADADAQQGPIPQEVYFPQTGHHVAEPFLTFWRTNGALAIIGYPVSEPLEQDGRTVQYFERARLEHHPELADAGYDVQLEHLGRWSLANANPPIEAIAPSDRPADHPSFRYFDATGFHIAFGFRKYWEENGGLAVFGYPVTTEFQENGRTVQYFERARFEWWPEHRGTPYEVLLGRLGAHAARDRGVATGSAARRAGVPDYSNSLWSRELELPVLMYHRFGDPASRYQMPYWRFEQQLDWLQSNGYTAVTLEQVFSYLDGHDGLPAKPVVLTFDDSHPSQWAAAEALNRRGMKGVFFVTLELGRMSDHQLRALANSGHEIASHTLSHPNLRLVSNDRLRDEVSGSKKRLEAITERTIRYFAYPDGEYDLRVIQAVQDAGYEGAVAAWGGKRWSPEKRWVEPRIEIGGTIPLHEFAAFVE